MGGAWKWTLSLLGLATAGGLVALAMTPRHPPLTPKAIAPQSNSITPWVGMKGETNLAVGGFLVLFPPAGGTLLGAGFDHDGLFVPVPTVDGSLTFDALSIGRTGVAVTWRDASHATHSARFGLDVEPIGTRGGV